MGVYGSNTTAIPVDPVNGRSKLVIIDHAGPTSYTTGGETFPQQSSFGGPNSVGLNSVSWVGGGLTEDGLYWVVPIFGGAGAEKGTIKLVWYSVLLTLETATATTGVMTQPAAAANLSASHIRLAVLGG
jgi:hypothetical protein